MKLLLKFSIFTFMKLQLNFWSLLDMDLGGNLV